MITVIRSLQQPSATQIKVVVETKAGREPTRSRLAPSLLKARSPRAEPGSACCSGEPQNEARLELRTSPGQLGAAREPGHGESLMGGALFPDSSAVRRSSFLCILGRRRVT
jgi:hypothetical protein